MAAARHDQEIGAASSKRFGTWWIWTVLLTLAACATSEPPAPDASMGLLIARDSCAGCHQIGGGGDSPNARAPTFREIASRPGMTPEALAAFLRDSHNYPVEMGFQLQPHQVDSLVAYMIRWRADAS